MRKPRKGCDHNYPQESRRYDLETKQTMVYKCTNCPGFLVITKKEYQPYDKYLNKFYKAIHPNGSRF